MAKLPRALVDPSEYKSAHPNILIYGPSGVGKTPWIMQLPRLLVLSVDPEGTISARTWGEGTKIWPIRRWPDFVAAMEYLEAGQDDFDYVLVDTIGTLQTRLLREILENAHKANPAKYHRDIPQIQDHQHWQLVLKRTVMDLNDMAITVIWTAHEMIRENSDGEEMTLPLLPGGKNQYEISMWVLSIMHIVGRVGVKAVQMKGGNLRYDRGVIFENRPPVVARDRTGTLPGSIRIAAGPKIETTFNEIMDMIAAGGEAAMERADAMVESRTDDPDDIEEELSAEDARSRDGDIQEESSDPDEAYAENAAREDAERDRPADPPVAKRAPVKKATGRKFRAADQED